MKLRIKYKKTGVLRFIGHLDVMRFYQKAIRRAKLDIKYTSGFSPHQIISFAAPMPLGMTSEGEYFDGEFNSVTSTEDMMNRLNATMPEGMGVLDIVMLPDDAKSSMSVVTASDYYIYKNDEAKEDYIALLKEKILDFYSQDRIEIVKKTKSKEELADIKGLIYELRPDKDGIYMMLAAGSKDNLKPELALEALCNFCKVSYNRYDYMLHRIETYMGDRESLVPLSSAGERF